METLAANRPLVHSDDTGVRILTLMAENETLAQGERTGIFTTGIVARGLDKTLAPIVLYASGRRHAGENMDQLLNQRTVQASKVIHMADASSMAPRSPLRITAKCMVHARRYFIEAEPAFPEHCDRVLEDIAAIYRNDDTRGMDPDERLAYHQQHSRPIMDALYKWIEEQFRERVFCHRTDSRCRVPRPGRSGHSTRGRDGRRQKRTLPGAPELGVSFAIAARMRRVVAECPPWVRHWRSCKRTRRMKTRESERGGAAPKA